MIAGGSRNLQIKIMNKEIKIGIIGLGYVGLPLAVEFAKIHPVVGFDINSKRLEEIKGNKDLTLEVDDQSLKDVNVKSRQTLESQKGLWVTNDK